MLSIVGDRSKLLYVDIMRTEDLRSHDWLSFI